MINEVAEVLIILKFLILVILRCPPLVKYYQKILSLIIK